MGRCATRGGVFDRDGTIEERLPEPSGSDVVVAPGAREALLMPARARVCCSLSANQSGIGRGYFNDGRLARRRQRFRMLSDLAGVAFVRIYLRLKPGPAEPRPQAFHNSFRRPK